jgi:REP element-mobilizing transposase RayT
MARPLRIECAGRVYCVTARGNAREPVFFEDADREFFIAVLREVVERYGWLCHACCLMGIRYHLLVETPPANLSRGMRQSTITGYVRLGLTLVCTMRRSVGSSEPQCGKTSPDP